MSELLEGLGVLLGDLPEQTKDVSYPEPVEGRVAHIDADFLAYQVSAETADELQGLKPRKTIEEMQHNAIEAANHLMRKAAATSYVCHVTPSGSDKGGRASQAVQQEYQGQRKDRDNKPEHLDAIRAYIGSGSTGRVHLHQEADDGMARENYDAPDPNLSIIVSMDKDLRMVPGLHYDFDTGQIVNVTDRFGEITLDDSKSAKKIVGWGTKFFWAQCLMGDQADSIKGIPACPGRAVQGATPTKAYTDLMRKYVDEEDPAKIAKMDVKLNEIYSKSKLCGAVLTFALLEHVKSDKEAFNLVRRLWQQLEEDCGHVYTHWNTGKRVTPTQSLLGEMQLLWMRRNDNPLDVVDWLKSL